MYHLDLVNHSKHKFNVSVNESKSKEANQMEEEKEKKDARYSSKTNQLGITYFKAINDTKLMLFYKVWIYADDTPQCINAHVFVIVILIMFHTNTCWMKHNVATPLWPSVGVKPNTPKVRDLESFRTPECLGFDSKA
jgi:hypothetical protein